jgi:hypothetical protein
VTSINIPSAASFLDQQSDVNPSAILFREFARYLLVSTVISQLPVSLDLIRKRHNLTRHAHPLPQGRGFLLGDSIFINSEDPDAVQRFTEAHEIMETLVIAIRPGIPAHSRTKFERDKEQWCEGGAAELLMPSELFFPLVKKQGINLDASRHLAGVCQTSLTATIRRMLDSNLSPCIFALLQEGYKKHQIVPSKSGQGVLWGNSPNWDPPAELRVLRHWKSPQLKTFLVKNESISHDCIAYQLYQSGIIGKVTSGRESLDLEKIKGVYSTEAMLVTINKTATVMLLIHL